MGSGLVSCVHEGFLITHATPDAGILHKIESKVPTQPAGLRPASSTGFPPQTLLVQGERT